jgi:hypothetical protein
MATAAEGTGAAARPSFGAAAQRHLVAEASRKSGLVWVNGQALWHVWIDDALWVVGGGAGEQPLPGLFDGGAARVSVRSKDKGGRLVTWEARVELVAPRSEAWEAAVAELKAKRLNSVDPEGVADRWAAECRVFRLTPQGLPAEHPGALSADSGAAAPVPSPAVTRHPIPAPLPRLLAGRRRKKS